MKISKKNWDTAYSIVDHSVVIATDIAAELQKRDDRIKALRAQLETSRELLARYREHELQCFMRGE